MKTYEEIVKTYKKRSHDTVVDTVATGMTYVDNIAVDSGLLEEAPDAYKDVNEIIEVVCNAGLTGKVAKLTPIGVVKG